MTTNLKAFAQSLAGYGWPIIALQPVVLGDKNSGKAPLIKGYPERKETSGEEVDQWWGEYPHANIGLVLGQVTGLWVLDVDPDKGGHLTLEDLELEHGPLETVEATTGSGGRHLYFNLPTDRTIRNRINVGKGLDVRAQGGQVVLPPSLHFSGNRYKWKTSPGDQDPSDAPEWLLDLVAPLKPETTPTKAFEPNDVRDPRAYARAALDRAVVDIQTASEGGRNDTLNRSAFGMRDLIGRGWIDRDQVESELRDAALSISDHSFKPREIEKTLLSGLGDAYAAELIAEGPIHDAPAEFDPSAIDNPAAYARGALNRAAQDLAADNIQAQAEGLAKFIELGWIQRGKVEEGLFKAGEAAGVAAGDVRAAINEGLGEASAPDLATTDAGNLVANEPARWADKVLALEFTDDIGRLTLTRWRDKWWRYAQDLGAYQEVEKDVMRATVGSVLDLLCVPGKEGPRRLVRTAGKVSDTLDALPERGRLAGLDEIPPFWFDGREIDPLRMVPVANGLLDLKTGKLDPPTPELFTLNPLPVGFDATKQCEQWYEFLRTLWPSPEGAESIRCLQQWFGYLLTPDTRQQKILLLHGPPRSGKGTILRVLGKLLGDNMASLRPRALLSNFGLQGLDQKLAVAFPDARFPTRVEEQSAIAELFLSISGEDPIFIDRKHRDPISTRLPARIVILSNEVPRLAESSGALANRFIALKTSQSFLGKEDLELEERLEVELPGILFWAIKGWRDLQESRRLINTERSKATIQEVKAIASPVTEFLEEYCDIHPDAWCDPVEFHQNYCWWCAKEEIKPLRQRILLREIQTQAGGVEAAPGERRERREDGTRFRPWLGIQLKGPFDANL